MADSQPEARRYRQVAVVHAVGVGDEMLAWDPRCQTLHLLNPSATAVFGAVVDWSTPQQVVERVRTSLALAWADLAADVDGCLHDLVRRELVEERPASAR